MEIMDLVRTRKSVRTFDGRALSDADREKLMQYTQTITNPFGIPVEFVLLDAKEHGLSSPVIQGEQLYITGKVPKVPYCEEAFGYSFEKLVLYAWSLGIGTTWIGGTMKRERFEQAAQVKEGEMMPCVSPLGYPAKKRSLKETAMRAGLRADKRLDALQMFYSVDFSISMQMDEKIVQDALEAVQLAPSAVNKQPWRIVRRKNAFHFYVKHSLRHEGMDIQKVDLGIAICHFMSVTNGTLQFDEPELSKNADTEYIATVVI